MVVGFWHNGGELYVGVGDWAKGDMILGLAVYADGVVASIVRKRLPTSSTYIVLYYVRSIVLYIQLGARQLQSSSRRV